MSVCRLALVFDVFTTPGEVPKKEESWEGNEHFPLQSAELPQNYRLLFFSWSLLRELPRHSGDGTENSIAQENLSKLKTAIHY